jgi:Sulfotransferase family
MATMMRRLGNGTFGDANDELIQAGSRRYPNLPEEGATRLALSFVTVRYSDELEQNLMRSYCVRDPRNELIVVDNRDDVFFESLSQAFLSGIERARHEIVVLVHEDVLLLPGWQTAFERSLSELERFDPEWGLLGAAGWTADSAPRGHWSDPYNYSKHFGDRRFDEVAHVDEHIMVLRRSDGALLDSLLPSIHNIGRDMALTLRSRGRRSYVVDAPTVHKYADAEGRLIQTPSDSPKILTRTSLTWLAAKACSDDYLARKWRAVLAPREEAPDASISEAERMRMMGAPVILLARGGSGSRLLSRVCGQLFLGNEVSGSGDTLELAIPIYKAVIAKYRCPTAGQAERSSQEIERAAYRMLERAGFPARWGFKVPEAMLLVDELAAAFPSARFLFLVRDPLSTCLRRTHMTARLDNEIGRALLPVAYGHVGRRIDAILQDSPAEHMAFTTVHQVEMVIQFLRRLPPARYLTVRFEDLLRKPRATEERVIAWLDDVALGLRNPVRPSPLEREIDLRRAAHPAVEYPEVVQRRVAALLERLRRQLGYAS